MSEGADRRRLVAARVATFVLPIVLLAPFAGKPYQADDHLTIWVAEQIARAPFDFFGFEVDYGAVRVPIHTISHNPPGTAYYLAAIGVLTNWNIVALHLGMSLFAGLAALAAFELARDLGARPLECAAGAVLTPAFLVSASTLMTDAPMAAFYTWAIVAWRRGCERGSWRWLCCAAACAAIAPLMKYFGLTLLPLLLLDGIMRRPRVRGWWGWLALPVAAFGALQAYTYYRYGVTPIVDAAGVASSGRWRMNEHGATRPLLTVVFLGGSALPLAIAGAARAGTRWTIAIGVAAVALCLPVVDGYSFAQLMIGASESFRGDVLIHLGVFLFAGLLLAVAAARGILASGARDGILLAAWVGGTLAFTAFLNHYVNVRTILPLVPALAVLVMPRGGGRAIPVATLTLGLLLSAWTLVADDDVASHDKRVAERALERARTEGVALHYVAFWGFEYHLMHGGATPLAFEEQKTFADPARPLMEPGSLLIVDAYARAAWTPVPRGFTLVEEMHEPYTLAATTFDSDAHAGFYWHGIGALPYRLGYAKPETFLLLRWEGNGQDLQD